MTMKIVDRDPSKMGKGRDPRFTKKKEDALMIEFKIDDILTDKGKMFDTEQVKVLQQMLNKYVMGEDYLSIDGQVGNRTMSAINEYRAQRKYWMNTGAIRVNPMHTADRYDIITNKSLSREDMESKLDSIDTHYDEISPGLYE